MKADVLVGSAPRAGRPCDWARLFGERLYIDHVLVARGRPGVHITLHGTIESGEGAGERITAQSRAGLFAFSCRIVAESFV